MKIDTNTILFITLVILAATGLVMSIRAYRKDKASLGNLMGGLTLVVTVIGIFISRNPSSDAPVPAPAGTETVVPPPAGNDTKPQPEPAAKPENSSGTNARQQTQTEPKTTANPAAGTPVQTAGTTVLPTQTQTQAPAQSAPADLSPADAYQAGKSAAQKSDFQQAAACYRSAAERGNAAAAYELALLYQRGSGVAKNESTAFTYMKAAADGGYTAAFRPLGEMYHGGRGVTKDRDTAAGWYKKAADLGDEAAKRILYNM